MGIKLDIDNVTARDLVELSRECFHADSEVKKTLGNKDEEQREADKAKVKYKRAIMWFNRNTLMKADPPSYMKVMADVGQQIYDDDCGNDIPFDLAVDAAIHAARMENGDPTYKKNFEKLACEHIHKDYTRILKDVVEAHDECNGKLHSNGMGECTAPKYTKPPLRQGRLRNVTPIQGDGFTMA